MNHYPHHIGDFAKKTKGLTLTERGAYRELLDQYYVHEKPLPLDRREVYRMAVAATPAERKAVDYIITKYFSEQPDGWHNKRADEEIARYRMLAEKARINGQRGGRPRTDPDTDPGGGVGGKSGTGSEPDRNLSGKLAVMPLAIISDAVRSESPTAERPRAHENGGQNGLKSQKHGQFFGWLEDDNVALAKGASYGIAPHPGEGWPAFRARILHAEAVAKRRA